MIGRSVSREGACSLSRVAGRFVSRAAGCLVPPAGRSARRGAAAKPRVALALLLVAAAAQAIPIDDALAAARRHSTMLRLDQIEVERTAAATDEAQARYAPTISFRGSGSFIGNPAEGIAISAGALGEIPDPTSRFPQPFPTEDFVLVDDQEYTYFQLKASLTQTLFAWGRIRNAVRIARLDEEIAGAALDETARALDRDVRSAYIGAYVSAQSAVTLTDMVSVLEQIVADEEQRFREGTVTMQDVLDRRAQLTSGRYRLVQAQQASQTAISVLAYLTGLPESDLDRLTLPPVEEPPPSFDEAELTVRAQAASAQLSKLSAQARQAAIFAEIENASRPLRPGVALSVDVEVSGQRVPFVAANWTDSWSANLIVSIGTEATLFDGGAARARTEQARLNAEAASYGRDELQNSLAIQVRRSVEAVHTSYAELESARATRELSEERYKNARVSYENELIPRRDERGALAMLRGDELAEASALLSYRTALNELSYLVGGMP